MAKRNKDSIIAKKESAPSLKPPKKWFSEKLSEVKKSNPSYSDETASATVGKIWSNLSDDKKSEIREREGKTYGPAPKEGSRRISAQQEDWPTEALEGRQRTFVTSAIDIFSAQYPMFPVTEVEQGKTYEVKTKTSTISCNFYMKNHYTLVLDAVTGNDAEFKPVEFTIGPNVPSPTEKIANTIASFVNFEDGSVPTTEPVYEAQPHQTKGGLPDESDDRWLPKEQVKEFNPERYDFIWNKDYTKFIPMKLKYWDDSSYIRYQSEDPAGHEGSLRVVAGPTTNITTEALVELFGVDEQTAQEIRTILNNVDFGYAHPSHAVGDALLEVNKLVNEKGSGHLFGVEGTTGEYSDRWISYLNTGDTYANTIIYDSEDGFYIGDWGSWVEEVEDKAEYENAKEHAKSTVESALDDVLKGYEDNYTFVGPEDTIDGEQLGDDFWTFLWDNYISNGKYDKVSEIADEKEFALEFLESKGDIKRTGTLRVAIDEVSDDESTPTTFTEESAGSSQFTDRDWTHIKETVKQMQNEWNPADGELPEEDIMTSVGYATVGLLDQDKGFVTAFGNTTNFDVDASMKKHAASPLLTGMAQAFWATAWADKMDETGHSSALSGQEITDIMPPVPPKAHMLAESLKKEIESTNNVQLDTFVPPGFDAENFSSDEEESLGWYLAMQSMGHGVSWADDHEDHGLKLPLVENYELWDDAEDAIDEEYGIGERGIDQVEEEPVEQIKPKLSRVIAIKDRIAVAQQRVEAMKLRVYAQELPTDPAMFDPADVDAFIGEVNQQVQSLTDISKALEQAQATGDWETIKKYMESGMIPATQGVVAALRRLSQATKSFSFPNLFSSEAKHWITTEVKRRAAEKARTSASPEQTLAFIDQAAKEVAEQMSQAVFSEIESVINKEVTQKIYDEISIPEEPVQTQPAPGALPPAQGAPPVPAVAPAPAPAPAPEVEGASLHMHKSLRIAFDNAAQHMQPAVEKGTWVMVDGPAGTEWIPAEYVNLDEVRQLIEQLVNAQVDLSKTSLKDYTENRAAWDIDIREGYGARLSAPGYLDATSWTVFDTEQEAEAFLQEQYGNEDIEEEAAAVG